MKKLLTTIIAISAAAIASAQTIIPTPQSAKISADKALSIQQGLIIKGAEQADKDAIELLKTVIKESKKAKFTLTIGERGDKVFAKQALPNLPNVSGAYHLTVSDKGITIVGNDERGTYYGVQTLKQLISGEKIPYTEITDFPDIKFRGTVEGFYGKPWSHRDRLAQLKFYGENKLNTYIYGPKDDPYHSSLSNHDGSNKEGGWRVPYPEAEARQISELAETAKRYKVDFVWAIHPGQDIKWTEEDYQNLIRKFESMYALGVRSFAVFFDDISGEGTNATKQAELLNRINREFITAKKDVTPLIMCPTEYNKSWANPTEQGYLSILGRELDKSVEIMWTGNSVCADITMETLEWITARIKRPVYIWWNFPVTDYVRHKVLLGPSYGLDTKATSRDMSGFVSNPMENAEASKVALVGVADYTWNIKAYNYLATWEEALKRVMPTAARAFRTFAIHSADMEQNGHGYRKDESWETKIIDPMDYSQNDYEALYKQFAELTAAPATIIKSGADPYLLQELTPWLVQAQLLGKRGTEAMELIKISEKGDPKAIWQAYLDGVMTPEQIAAYSKNKPGTLVLQPFINNTRTAVGEKLYEQLAGEKLIKTTPMTSFARKETLPSMMDGNAQTYFYSWGAQKVGDWVGVDLGEQQPISAVIVEQGRKNKDRDYFQRAVLECSTDNQNWTELLTIGDSTYTINYKSAKPITARYMRVRATEGISTKNWTAFRRFDVNPILREPIIMTNTAQLSSAKVNAVGNTISIQPVLEVITLKPNDYFGIELPMVTKIAEVKLDLKKPKAAVEYSVDGVNWSKNGAEARYVRYVNKSSKAEQLNLRRFEIVGSTTSDGDVLNLFDKNYATKYAVKGSLSLARPTGATRVAILAENGSKATIYSVTKGGAKSKLGEIDGSFFSSKLDGETTQILIEGDITLAEVVWGV